jgi:hypothetical protein
LVGGHGEASNVMETAELGGFVCVEKKIADTRAL